MKSFKEILLRGIIVVVLGLFMSVDTVLASNKLDCQNNLSYSSRGSEVKILQRNLNKTMKCNLEVDGIFGDKTKACVLSFQDKYQLDVDGIVGVKTCSKLNSIVNKSDKRKYVVVTTEELNVRESASLSSDVLKRVKLGTVLRVYGKSKVDGNTWYKVLANNSDDNKVYGYVSGKYVNDTAIVLNIKRQELKFYQDGKILLDTSVVTGTKGKHDTPVGHYVLSSKNKVFGKTLRGKNDDGSSYASYVDYWMPFITSRGIGFHDASWRTSKDYNSNTYKSHGSHGCVNMMHDDAKLLYDNIQGNVDVIVK